MNITIIAVLLSLLSSLPAGTHLEWRGKSVTPQEIIRELTPVPPREVKTAKPKKYKTWYPRKEPKRDSRGNVLPEPHNA